MNQSDLKEILSKGLRQLNLAQPIDDKQQSSLIQYVDLLNKWNKTYNLTAVRKPDQMVTRHIIDSLSICPYLRGKHILDVGTGAGLPGIPLAIAFPERNFTLLDSNNKKTRFVTQAVSELELSNVDVVQSRVENFQTSALFDTITTRAYSAMGDMVKQTSHLLAADGTFLAMKGTNPVAEMDGLPSNYKIEENHIIKVPGLDEERHLLEIRVIN
ncbi:MAG: 16S rRNA (guanine(527)-N(7))-methyltransferase RsmG [Gammaproteobacteria bacterium]|nr:16S rRNA (guanine(527)-N(7))-methyltransferase RsmG [Gammaproteobacteria bacterium]MCW8987269.1 16S rRNA (guanine(527)-N(7))-methyltransferase RsmG [Gammaproteobacteria bacterium]MCW9031768.1 16S rRNA (guanine(527)-N(7))-methyltransferase RsmG [Gammaproteobacteria bacterium]